MCATYGWLLVRRARYIYDPSEACLCAWHGLVADRVQVEPPLFLCIQWLAALPVDVGRLLLSLSWTSGPMFTYLSPIAIARTPASAAILMASADEIQRMSDLSGITSVIANPSQQRSSNHFVGCMEQDMQDGMHHPCYPSSQNHRAHKNSVH